MTRILLVMAPGMSPYALMADSKSDLKSSCLELKNHLAVLDRISRTLSESIKDAEDEDAIYRIIASHSCGDQPKGYVGFVNVLNPPKSRKSEEKPPSQG